MILSMKHTIGVILQLLVLAILPMVIVWQLNFGFQLIVMPIALVTAICVFSIGTMLRDSKP